jgi:tetratricopeptide (TPR) repeat protein
LDLPLPAREERDPQVAEVTTDSPEAYRYYLEGTEQLARFSSDSARQSFERALEYDSSFAMAYYYLAGLKDASLITRAVELLNNASERDQFFIRSRAALVSGNLMEAGEILTELVRRYPQEKEAWYTLAAVDQRLGRRQEAIAHYERAIDIDPLFKRAYNALAYLYEQSGDLDRALWAINHYIELAPDEPNPWDTRGELLARNGRLQEAIESYRQALEISPTFMHSLHYLGLMYLFSGDYVRADSCNAALADSPNTSLAAASGLYLCFTPMMQGKFTYAIQKIDSTIRADSLEANRTEQGDIYEYLRTLQALAYWQKGNLDSAIVMLEAGQRHADSCDYACGQDRRHLRAQLLALDGKVSEAEAIVGQLREQLRRPEARQFTYWYAAGALALVAERFDEAVVNFETAADITDGFDVRYWLARAYLQAGNFDRAIEAFESLARQYDSPRSYFSPWSVRLHYYLGRSYELSDRLDDATQQYLIFLDIWKNADPEVALLDSARIALNRVNSRL